MRWYEDPTFMAALGVAVAGFHRTLYIISDKMRRKPLPPREHVWVNTNGWKPEDIAFIKFHLNLCEAKAQLGGSPPPRNPAHHAKPDDYGGWVIIGPNEFVKPLPPRGPGSVMNPMVPQVKAAPPPPPRQSPTRAVRY